MAEDRSGIGSQGFPGEHPGTTGGSDAGTLERSRGTAGPRAGDGLSPEELSARAMVAATPGHTDESAPAVADKGLHEQLPDLNNDELARLSVLSPGTPLDQGGTYLDLNDLGRGPFKAIGGQEAEAGARLVAKRDTDYELWNRLTGRDREATVVRPATEQ